MYIKEGCLKCSESEEFMGTDNSQDFDMDLELTRLLKKRNLPILTLDERWHRLFPEPEKTDAIRRLEKDVNTWLKKQGRMNTDLEDVKRVKARLMQNIVDNMKESSGEDEKLREKRLEKSQQLIREANDKITQLEIEQTGAPDKLNKLNRELLEESVELCYDKLLENKEEIDEITQWVTEIRIELKKRLIMKQEMEDENEAIYSNLHGILGPELMEYFDREYGED